MRVRYSFSSRKTKKLDSHNKHKKEFPEVLRELISDSNIILEILDASFWRQTRNSELEKLAKDKKLIFVLNKVDLVDKKDLTRELEDNSIFPFVLISCKTRRGVGDLRDRIKIEAKKLKEKASVAVVGYPNTGKSSVINILKGKQVSKVSNESGFTKGIQKIKLSKDIYLIDSPGVIPSTEDSSLDNKDLLKHVRINVRKWDKVRDPEILVNELFQKYPELFKKYYNIDAEDSEVLIESVGRKRGFLKKGNLVNTDRASRSILKDLQERKIR